MGSSLRDIPGAGGGKKKGRLGKVARGPGGKPWLPPKTAGPLRAAKARTGPALRFQGPRWDVDRFNLVLGLAFVALFVVGGIWLVRANRVTVTSDFEDGGAVRTTDIRSLVIDVQIQPSSRIEDTTVRLDGTDITDDLEITDTGFVWGPPENIMEEGTYELSVDVPKAIFGIETWSMTFGVDDTPPVLDVPTPERIGIGDELTLSGTVDERVDLTAEEEPVEVDEDGHFTVTFPLPPAGSVDFVATDLAGNATPLAVPVSVAPPSTHGLYLSPDAWADESLRDGALALLDDGQVDTVVLDVKDECGVVPFAADVDLAGDVGAVDDRYDLEDAIATVHDHGGQVIGRLVTFRDPLLARWAWANGHEDWVLQDTANDPWPVYGDGEGCPAAANAEPIAGGFTNYASPDVWDYNLALAEEVAGLGVDNLLLDDVRRPDGDLTFLNAVGITGTNVETLTAFLAEAQARVRAEGAYLGATTTGISVRDPLFYDQDLASMATAVDYLAPEVYPETYSSGYFNLPDPQTAPGGAVEGAVTEAKDQLGDRPTPIVPWLQDYSADVPYGVAEVQAQVDGAAAAGSCSWIVRDTEFTYTEGITTAC